MVYEELPGLDEDGYPTEDALEEIRNWDPMDPFGLMDYVYDLWWAADWGWEETVDRDRPENHYFHISTGGWSGNEDIISAMEHNFIFWVQAFRMLRAGGHYVFRIEEKESIKKRFEPEGE
jgi:hypothetical protein